MKFIKNKKKTKNELQIEGEVIKTEQNDDVFNNFQRAKENCEAQIISNVLNNLNNSIEEEQLSKTL